MTDNIEEEELDFKVLATMRYDPWLLNMQRFNRPDDSFIQIQSNWGLYQLSDDDMGYNFPNTKNIEDIRSKTNFGEVVRSKEWTPPPYLIIHRSELYHRDVEEVELMKKFILGRCLFYKQHFQRILYSIKTFGMDSDLTAEKLEQMLFKTLVRDIPYAMTDKSWKYRGNLLSSKETAKIRICVNSEGNLWFQKVVIDGPTEFSPNHFMRNILGGLLESTKPTWDVFMDDIPMVASKFTTFKTTKRDHYDAARERMLIKAKEFRGNNYISKAEVLLFNDQNLITEGSITNIAVKVTDGMGTRYVTPYLTSGCLCGVMRYYLLKKGHIVEGDVPKDSIKNGDVILIFNGVMGCVKGTVRM